MGRLRSGFFGFYLLAALLCAAVGPRGLQASVKSLDEIQQMAFEGDYDSAASELERVIKLNPDSDAAHKYDYYLVGMLDGECQLHTGSRSTALKAIQIAIDNADEADDQDKLAASTAFYVMVDHSKNNKYTPRTGDNRAPINVLDPKARKAAYPIVLADELDASKNDRWKAKAKVSLTPVLAAAKHLAGIRALEHLVTGKTEQTEKLGIAQSKDARELILDWIRDRNHDLTRLETNAAKKVKVQVPTANGFKMRWLPAGLSQSEAAQVQSWVGDCAQMPDALTQINKGFGGTLQLDGIYRASDDVKQRGQDLLNKYVK